MFWHALHYHHKILNRERMSLRKLVVVLLLQSAVKSESFTREKKEKWKERVT